MGTALFSVPAPQQTPLFPCSYAAAYSRRFHGSRTSFGFSSSGPSSLLYSSSSSSASVVDEEKSSSPADELPLQSGPNADDISFRGCKGCGKEEIERGCNGEGRIQGGIATFPGFGWWPIKAYRPCPGFLASGGRYKRKGQSMDEVASGAGKREASAGSSSKNQSSKKNAGPR